MENWTHTDILEKECYVNSLLTLLMWRQTKVCDESTISTDQWSDLEFWSMKQLEASTNNFLPASLACAHDHHEMQLVSSPRKRAHHKSLRGPLIFLIF